jgi:type IV pilus assembly protein PilX
MNIMKPYQPNLNLQGPASQQRGAVLIVSLLILLVLTVVGISSSRTTTLEEKMAGNMRDKDVSFQAAEAAIREGELWLKPLKKEPVAVVTCNTPPCDVWQAYATPIEDYLTKPFTWWQSQGNEYGDPSIQEFTDAAADPVYMLEEFSNSPTSLVMGRGTTKTRRTVYRVTAAGIGGIDTTRTMIESMYANEFFGH